MVTVHVPEFLRRWCDGHAEIEAAGGTVGEVVEHVVAGRQELRSRLLDGHGRIFPYLLVFRNGDEVPRAGLMSAPLDPTDVVEIVAGAEGGSGADAFPDVRMRGFERRTSVEEALRVALAGIVPCPAVEVELDALAGEVLAEDVTSDVDVPPFPRASMDGYAVRGADTFGASSYDPLTLALVGESMPGRGTDAVVGARQCVRIMTGAPVPPGADAVLPAEIAREVEGRVLVEGDVTPGKNVGALGEDVRRGDVVLGRGRRLRPQDLGLLASIGRRGAAVRGHPRVTILVTGDELVPPGTPPAGARIVDSNSVVLRHLVQRDHGRIAGIVRVADGEDAIRRAFADLRATDVVLTSGATSVGREDFVPQVVREMGDLLVHGVAMRPSSPTGIGRIGEARVFLLPGNPVSCLAAYDFFAGPAIRTMAGLPAGWPYRSVRLALRRRIVSQIGRTDYVRVALTGDAAEPIAVSGASILSSTTRAGGFVIVPHGSEGVAEGDEVDVFLYDPWPGGA